MELFSVFVRIALDIQEFEEGLNNAMKSMAEFVDAVDEKANAVSEILNRMVESVSIAEDIGENLTQTMEYMAEFVQAVDEKTQAISEFAETAAQSLEKINEAMDELSIAFVTGDEQASESATGIGESIMRIVGYIATLSSIQKAADLFIRVFTYIKTNIDPIIAALTTAWTWIKIFGSALAGAGLQALGLSGVSLPALTGALGSLWTIIKTVAAAIFSWKGVLVAFAAVAILIRDAIRILAIYFIYLALTCEDMQARLSKVWDHVKITIASTLENIQEHIGIAAGYIEKAIDLIKAHIRFFVAAFTGDWEGAFEAAMDIAEIFMKLLPEELADMVYIGKNAVRGLWEGFNNMRMWISNKVADFARINILGAVQRALNINSPSKVFADEVGKMIVKGIAKGIDDEAYSAEESAIRMAKDMLDPQVEMFELSFMEISEIVVRALEQMSRKAIQIIRTLTATMDAVLNHDGFRIGRNFFRALGDGLIAEEAALLSRASWVADAIRREFGSLDGNPGLAAVNAAQSWANHHPQFMDMASMPMAAQSVNVTQNFYGVREKETAYQAYRAAQRVAWGVER